MASQFKNRLVGVTILVASVVIFLPSIIDGKKTAYQDEFISTPIKPQLKEHLYSQKGPAIQADKAIEPQEAKQLGVTKTAENSQWEIEEVAETVTVVQAEQEKIEAQQERQAEPVIKMAVKKTAKVKVPEKAWTIQLGAFQNAANINQLLKKLHKAGYQAHTIPTDVIDGELTRVFVGPNVSKSKLESQLPQLKRLTKLQGKLLAFDAVYP